MSVSVYFSHNISNPSNNPEIILIIHMIVGHKIFVNIAIVSYCVTIHTSIYVSNMYKLIISFSI